MLYIYVIPHNVLYIPRKSLKINYRYKKIYNNKFLYEHMQEHNCKSNKIQFSAMYIINNKIYIYYYTLGPAMPNNIKNRLYAMYLNIYLLNYTIYLIKKYL